MENCKNTDAPSVKSERRLLLRLLGTGLNMTEPGWVVKYRLSVSPLLIAALEYDTSMKTHPLQKSPPLSLQALTESFSLHSRSSQTC